MRCGGPRGAQDGRGRGRVLVVEICICINLELRNTDLPFPTGYVSTSPSAQTIYKQPTHLPIYTVGGRTFRPQLLGRAKSGVDRGG